jgi:4-amino-4-deoxy-L-arabinose transferase-like glycosyltransferase
MRTFYLPDKPVLDLTLLTLLCALLFAVGLGDRPYAAPSEARYVELGREMAESGDFVTPRLNYVKYFEKPPLFYWVQAASTKLWGLDEFKARAPTAVFTVLLCLITYGLARMLYGRLAGWLATLTLASSLYVFALSRVVLVDMPVSVFLVATLSAFLYAARTPESRTRTFLIYIMYTAAAGATLTKGLIGFVLPGAVIFLWLAITGRWSLLKTLRLPTGILFFLLLAAPWHVLVSDRNPEFAHFYFIHEHFERYLTREHGRYQPVWFFVPVLLLGLFPWFTFTVQALQSGLTGFWQRRHENGDGLFLVLWIAFIFIFFSLSDSKLIPYILPVFPPIAALLGRYFTAAWKEEPAPDFKAGFFATLALLITAGGTLPVMSTLMDADNKVLVALGQASSEAQHFSIACFVAAMVLFIVYLQGRTRHVIVTLILTTCVILQLGDAIAAHYDKDSMQAFGGIIRSLAKPDAEVAAYDSYYQDLPIYTGQRITIANWKGELEFGAEHEDTSAWIIDDKEFWKRWLKPKHLMFAVMRYESYVRVTKDLKPEKLHLYMLQQLGRNILFVNVPPQQLLPKK